MIHSAGHLDALLRGLVLGKLGKAGHKPTLEEARRRFRGHVEGKQILPADLRSPVSDSAVYGHVPAGACGSDPRGRHAASWPVVTEQMVKVNGERS